MWLQGPDGRLETKPTTTHLCIQEWHVCPHAAHADDVPWTMGECAANKCLLTAPFPVIITEHFVENLENGVFLPAFYEVEIKPPKPTKSNRNPLCQTSCTHVCAGSGHEQKAACLWGHVGTKMTAESDIWQSWAREGMLWLGGSTPDNVFCLIYDLEVKQSSPVHLSLHKLMKQMHYLLLKEQNPEPKQRLG